MPEKSLPPENGSTRSSESNSSACSVSSESTEWCVVCQGCDELSRPVIMEHGLTETEAKERAAAAPHSMWTVTMAWTRAQYDAWKRREEKWKKMMHGKEPQKMVIYSTPNGSDHFYQAWVNSQNVTENPLREGAKPNQKTSTESDSSPCSESFIELERDLRKVWALLLVLILTTLVLAADAWVQGNQIRKVSNQLNLESISPNSIPNKENSQPDRD